MSGTPITNPIPGFSMNSNLPIIQNLIGITSVSGSSTINPINTIMYSTYQSGNPL
jgi:hypothetical protein